MLDDFDILHWIPILTTAIAMVNIDIFWWISRHITSYPIKIICIILCLAITVASMRPFLLNTHNIRIIGFYKEPRVSEVSSQYIKNALKHLESERYMKFTKCSELHGDTWKVKNTWSSRCVK